MGRCDAKHGAKGIRSFVIGEVDSVEMARKKRHVKAICIQSRGGGYILQLRDRTAETSHTSSSGGGKHTVSHRSGSFS